MTQYPKTNNIGDKVKLAKLFTSPLYMITYPVRIKIIPIKKSQ